MINKDIYDKAFDLMQRLDKDFIGYTHDFIVCYVLTEAIENLKKEMEDVMAKKMAKKTTAKKATPKKK